MVGGGSMMIYRQTGLTPEQAGRQNQSFPGFQSEDVT